MTHFVSKVLKNKAVRYIGFIFAMVALLVSNIPSHRSVADQPTQPRGSASIIDVRIDCSVDPIKDQFGFLVGWHFSVTGSAVPPTPAPPFPINVKVHMPWAPYATEGLSPVTTQYDYQGATPPYSWDASAETFQQPGYAGSLTQCTFNFPPDQTNPELSVQKTGPATIVSGNTVAYTLTVKNTGTGNATGVIVSDVYPQTQLTYVSSSIAVCKVASAGTVQCPIGDLASGATKTITLTFTVKTEVACETTVTNKAQLTADQQVFNGLSVVSSKTQNCPPPPGTLVCNPTTQTITLGNTATLTAIGGTGQYAWSTQDATPTTGTGTTFAPKYTSGGTKTVTVTSGTQTKSCSVVVVVPPPQLVCNPTIQTVNVNQVATLTATGGTGSYVWYAPGAETATASGTVFTAKYQTGGTKTVILTSGTQTATCAITVQTPPPPPAHLSIEKVVRNVTQNSAFVHMVNAKQGETVEYRVRVWNDGQTTVHNVVVTDALTNGNTLTNFVAPTVSGANSSGSLYNGGINLGTLVPNQSVLIVYRYTVQGQTTSIGVCNTVTATSSASVIRDSACVTVPQVQSGNVILSFAKAASNDTKKQDATKVTASPEDFITYTLTVKNTGTSDQTNFTITDDLSGVLPLADMIDTGGATLSGTVLTYPQTTVPANGSIQRQFKVRIKASLASNISYVMANTYGNTVSITINKPQTYTAPKTGGNTTPLAATGFGIVLAAVAAVATNANLRKMIFG